MNSEKVKILDIKDLRYLSKDQQWTPRRSGILIKENDKLEKEWYNFLNNNNLFSFINDKQTFIEGAAYQITQTFYERSSYARKVCLNYYGYSCVICGFNFKDIYGEIGEGYIHVHHLKQLSIVKESIIDPIKDLRPVCPNCHAMLHKVNPPYTLEELKQSLQSSKK